MAVDVDQLILEYLGLSQALARQQYRTAPHALDLDELTGIAYLALVGAARRWMAYCSERGHDPEALQFFKPFVVQRVRGGLIDAIRASDWATRSLRYRARALQDAGQDKGVSERELADRSGLSIREVRSTIQDMSQRRPMSIEAEELDPTSGRAVESDALSSHVLTAMVDSIRDLEPEQQVVLALHYFEELQLRQVAKAMGISESRVSKLHALAVLAVHERMMTAVEHQESE